MSKDTYTLIPRFVYIWIALCSANDYPNRWCFTEIEDVHLMGYTDIINLTLGMAVEFLRFEADTHPQHRNELREVAEVVDEIDKALVANLTKVVHMPCGNCGDVADVLTWTIEYAQALWHANISIQELEADLEEDLTILVKSFNWSDFKLSDWWTFHNPCHGAMVPKTFAQSNTSFDYWFLGLSFGGFLLVLIFVPLYCVYLPVRKHRNKQKAEEGTRLHYESSRMKEIALVSGNYELWSHPKIPEWICLLVPALLVLSEAAYIYAHIDWGALIIMKVKILRDEPSIPPLFKFNLKTAVDEMWEGHIYVLVMLIAGFSGGWPHVKNLVIMASWAAPIPASLRKKWLSWLDVLGKYSLIDLFVMIIMMVSFRMHVDPLQADMVVFDLVVTPGLGLFSFLFAVVLSLAATDIVLYYEELSQMFKTDLKMLPRRSVSGTEIEIRTDEGIIVQSFTMLGKCCITFLLLLTVCLLVAGANVSSFEFIYGGLVSVFMDNPKAEYSQIQIAEAVKDIGHDFPSYVLWGVYLFFSIFIPISHLICLLLLWLCPLSLAYQRRLMFLTHMHQAWGCLEVVVLSMFAALLELTQFVDFIEKEYCWAVDEMITPLLKNTDVQPLCIFVKSELLNGSWILLACALIYMLISQLVEHLAGRAIDERRRMSGLRRGTSLEESGSMDKQEPEAGECCKDCDIGCLKMFFCIRTKRRELGETLLHKESDKVKEVRSNSEQTL